MTKRDFDYQRADSQATAVDALDPQQFDFERYADYEHALRSRCDDFRDSTSGVLVYRRMRVGEVFSYACSDMQRSLQLQLGALAKSMAFKADIPNFLEPWYGIGTAASAYGIEYVWHKDQAPAVAPKFGTVEEALQQKPVPIKETPIGRHTLEMIRYFMKHTKGMLPVSFCDVQSPFNAAPNIVDTSGFMLDLCMNPDGVKEFLDILATRIGEFCRIQQEIIGESLVLPGHGFASCREFKGIGMSEDNVVMVSPQQYIDVVTPSVNKIASQFGGAVFHSCGNWSDKIDAVKSLNNLVMVDAAFSEQTDPSPNPPERFRDAFCDTGIIVNARIVGGLEVIEEKVRALWKPGMKCIVVTYCPDPLQQEKAYHMIHDICV